MTRRIARNIEQLVIERNGALKTQP